MIGTHETFGVAVVAAHDTVATMAAHVQQGMHGALGVPGQNDRVFPHIGVEVIVRPGDQAFMPDHQPRSAEDLGHLFVVHCLVAEDAAVYLASDRVDNVILRRASHTEVLSVQRRGPWPQMLVA